MTKDQEEGGMTAEPEKEEEEEEDLEKLQAEIEKMEAEAARITKENEDLEKGKPHSSAAAAAGGKKEDPKDVAKRDGLSIYVGQVDYMATPEELLSHFEACGTVERVTIVCDKLTGKPKGFAYIEFGSEDAVENAIKLDGSTFRERTLKVTHKRVNDPNYFYHQDGGGRGGGRGFRGRGGFRGGGRGGGFRGGGRGGGRGRGGGGFRGGYGGGRGGGSYHPYY
ncbi:hypothetical protein MHU86_25615 [Fragilaria crotonensis]|nr:hypothetical protein MHU86_25615 [Fragilaria crotonensis]